LKEFISDFDEKDKIRQRLEKANPMIKKDLEDFYKSKESELS